jgi:D-glycero-alpha-D-manno-heptose-7-phosphate kinase
MNAKKLNGIFTTSAPLRVPIAGGGTDLPEYYSRHEAIWLTLAINKKVQVVAHKNVENEFLIHYKNNERCQSVNDIKHPIIREMLKDFQVDEPLVIHSISELAGNSGMGSSSNFALCLAKLLSQFTGRYIQNLPEYVFNFERNILKEFVGKQDQYSAFAGGLNIYKADKSGNVTIEPFLTRNQIENLCNHLIMVKAGEPRLANESLQKQAAQLVVDSNFENKYHKTKEIAYQVIDILKKNDITSFGRLVEEHWQNKLNAFNNNFHQEVFEVDEMLKQSGAIGTKLCGAGSSGYMLGIFEDANQANAFIEKSNKISFLVRPDFTGLS